MQRSDACYNANFNGGVDAESRRQVISRRNQRDFQGNQFQMGGALRCLPDMRQPALADRRTFVSMQTFGANGALQLGANIPNGRHGIAVRVHKV
jgi:hypothetical protein